MTDHIEAIRARHADRLRTRAAKGDGSVQMSTLVDDDMAVLLAALTEVRAILRKRKGQQYVGQLGLWVEIDAVVNPGTPEDRLRAALAPVAPDAEPGGGGLTIEPTKAGSRVRDAQGRLWHLNGKGDGYAGAWRLTPGGALPWACLVRDYGPLTLEPTP